MIKLFDHINRLFDVTDGRERQEENTLDIGNQEEADFIVKIIEAIQQNCTLQMKSFGIITCTLEQKSLIDKSLQQRSVLLRLFIIYGCQKKIS